MAAAAPAAVATTTSVIVPPDPTTQDATGETISPLCEFGKRLGFKPTSLTGELKDEPSFIFYLDGSGETSTNTAAAAIVVRYGYSTHCHALLPAVNE